MKASKLRERTAIKSAVDEICNILDALPEIEPLHGSQLKETLLRGNLPHLDSHEQFSTHIWGNQAFKDDLVKELSRRGGVERLDMVCKTYTACSQHLAEAFKATDKCVFCRDGDRNRVDGSYPEATKYTILVRKEMNDRMDDSD